MTASSQPLIDAIDRATQAIVAFVALTDKCEADSIADRHEQQKRERS